MVETVTVRKLQRRRAARLATRLDNGITVLLALVGFVGGAVLGTALVSHWDPVLGLVGFIPVVLAVGTVVLVMVYTEKDCLEVPDSQAARLLITGREVWCGLPADLRDRTRPIIDAAYAAAMLPRDAAIQVGHRVSLLRKFASEAERMERERQMQALGGEDLEAGEAYLMSLRALQDNTGGGS